jgi:two-component system, OmpR family, alkaline phosphatase synthesis response regulator PhoP
MPQKILIIEDEPGIQMSLKDEFESHGYEILEAADGAVGLDLARKERLDLIILDLKLPRINGLEVLRTLRQEHLRTPVIILTVRNKEIDKVMGLEIGADDYVTKPFSLWELSARVKAILRRAADRESGVSEYRFATIALDFRRYEATKDGRKLELTPLEFDLLRLLINKKGQVLTRDEILDAIWGADNLHVAARTMDTHIANIRRKIEDHPESPRFILSIRRVGYKFTDI